MSEPPVHFGQGGFGGGVVPSRPLWVARWKLVLLAFMNIAGKAELQRCGGGGIALEPGVVVWIIHETLLRLAASPHWRRWACFERHRAFTNALSLSKLRPPCHRGLSLRLVTIFMNNPG